MKVGLLGDVHGSKLWTLYALQRLQNEGVTDVWQLGDFGIGLSSPSFINGVDAFLRFAKMRLWVTPGNHEDYDIIGDLPLVDGTLYLTDAIRLFPRGYRFNLGGRSVVSLGGAPSVDRAWRTADENQLPGRKLWWPEEQITGSDVDKVVAGGHADIMLAHDAPHTKTVDDHIKHNPFGFKQIDILYAEEGRRLMDEAFAGVKPDVFLHGHYHLPVYDVHHWPLGHTSRIIGFEADGGDQNFGIIDLDTLEVTALPDQRYIFEESLRA